MHNVTLEAARIFRNNCGRAWFVGQYTKIHSQTVNVGNRIQDLLSSALQFSLAFESVRNTFLSFSSSRMANRQPCDMLTENNHILSYQPQPTFVFGHICHLFGKQIQNFCFIYSQLSFCFPLFCPFFPLCHRILSF